jgi:hypothetical protein
VLHGQQALPARGPTGRARPPPFPARGSPRTGRGTCARRGCAGWTCGARASSTRPASRWRRNIRDVNLPNIVVNFIYNVFHGARASSTRPASRWRGLQEDYEERTERVDCVIPFIITVETRLRDDSVMRYAY